MKDLPLLIEIFTEELPALPLLKEFPSMSQKWQEIAKDFHITSTPRVYYTPRRIVLYDEHFPLKSEDFVIESYGPPLEIALNADKSLTKVGESFLKKLNVPLDSQWQIAKKGGKSVMHYIKKQEGRKSAAILGEILNKWIDSLHFGKSMLWGENNDSFIRPVRNILIMLGENLIKFNRFGIESSKQTFVHRSVSFAPFSVESSKDYFEILAKNFVILEQEKREAQILNDIKEIEKNEHITVEIDKDLLKEIVAITESPRAVYASFDKAFLRLPNEVIITSMKEHQRYFATYQNGALHNGFVLVTNATAKDLKPIIEGNQKVLKARLKDALFFYDNDLKNGFMPEKLREIVFVEGLGSLLDKSSREYAIALELLNICDSNIKSYLSPAQAKDIITQALKYAKADLLSEMVYEFPELQGIMGYYYALNFNFHPIVALAIKEQYLPTGEDSPLPSHILSGIVALSVKFDNIFALFSINKIPTGSKDPFALRRAAIGIIKIIKHFDIHFSFKEHLAQLYEAGGYKSSDLARLEAFFYERLEGILGINPSILRCVWNANSRFNTLSVAMDNALALNEFFEKSDKNALIALFKRVANILSDENRAVINENLFTHPAEKALYQALQDFRKREFHHIEQHINALFDFNLPLEAFFESVLVNDENPAIKANRTQLIREIYDEFLRIGDMKEISL